MIQRFDFFCYEGEIPYEDNKERGRDRDLINFVMKLSQIMEHKMRHSSDLLAALGVPVELGLTDEAEEIRKIFSKKIIDQANKYNQENNPGFTGITSRMYRAALKYAMIYHVSDVWGTDEGLGGKVGVDAILYGINVAELLGEWKINALPNKVYEGDFHRDCEIFKDAIRGAIRKKRSPTGRALANRKRRLKQLKPKDWDAIIKALKARKEIIVDESGKSTKYYLTKNIDE